MWRRSADQRVRAGLLLLGGNGGGVMTTAETELAAFRETARAWLRANATPRSDRVAGRRTPLRQRRGVPRPALRRGAGPGGAGQRLAAPQVRRRVRGLELARGDGRGGPHDLARRRVRPGGEPLRGAGTARAGLRDPAPRRAHAAPLRDRGSPHEVPHAVPARRRPVLSALLRAVRGLRPCRTRHQGDQRRGRLGRQRSEGLELRCAVRRLRGADRPLGPERSQARRADRVPVAARPARRGGPAVEADVGRPLVL